MPALKKQGQHHRIPPHVLDNMNNINLPTGAQHNMNMKIAGGAATKGDPMGGFVRHSTGSLFFDSLSTIPTIVPGRAGGDQDQHQDQTPATTVPSSPFNGGAGSPSTFSGGGGSPIVAGGGGPIFYPPGPGGQLPLPPASGAAVVTLCHNHFCKYKHTYKSKSSKNRKS